MNRQAVSRAGLYPVNDLPPEAFALSVDDRRNLRAQWTGEPRRAIRKGEYYLSGADVQAYRARGELAGPYHPATLVIAEPVVTHSIRRITVPASAL